MDREIIDKGNEVLPAIAHLPPYIRLGKFLKVASSENLITQRSSLHQTKFYPRRLFHKSIERNVR